VDVDVEVEVEVAGVYGSSELYTRARKERRSEGAWAYHVFGG
jgi:hypothetical protein